MTTNGNFKGALKHLCDKATKSMERLKKVLFSSHQDLQLYLHLFEKKTLSLFFYMVAKFGEHIIFNQTNCYYQMT